MNRFFKQTMEKGIIKLITTALLASLLLSACTSRTPESILKLQFNISLKDFDYEVTKFEEQWLPNGDGHVLIEYKFSKLSQSNIKYLLSLGAKELPIKEKNKIPDIFMFSSGYYLYECENLNDIRDFKLFVIDKENNKAILYYQYL